MDFLSGTTGLIAAAIAVPSLVILYFLKRKRRDMPISSTLLWRRAVRDLEANAPFQRLRRNLLLLVQLLILSAVLLALARPVLRLRGAAGERYVILIDVSASMNATHDGQTRLDEARRRAREFVGTLRREGTSLLGDRSDVAMVVAFSDRPEVMCSFTSDPATLRAALDAIEPTDGPSRLGEALTVARAFAEPVGEEMNSRSAERPARLVLFSDGRLSDLDQLFVDEGELTFFRVGQDADNVAVTAMQARRSHDDPREVQVFATVSNYSPAAVTTDVELLVDDVIRSVRAVTIPAMDSADAGRPDRPGSVSVGFSLPLSTGAVLTVRHLHEDALAADNAAWAHLPPPRDLVVLLVTPGNPALELAMQALPLARLDVQTPSAFAARDAGEFESARQYDVVVLDGPIPGELPRGHYLAFGPPPAGMGAAGRLVDEPTFIVDWQTRHPAMEHVDLNGFYAASRWRLTLPREAAVLAEFPDAPAMAILRRSGRTVLLAGFDVMETNWPFQPGFVMFCLNAVRFLASDAEGGQAMTLAVGEPILFNARRPLAEVSVSGPGLPRRTVQAAAGGIARLARTRRAGVYVMDAPGRAAEAFAVNLTDPDESLLLCRDELTLTGRTIESTPAAEAGRINRELAGLLVLVAMGLVAGEWLLYLHRARG